METLESRPEDLLGFRGGFFNKALRAARLAKGLTQRQMGLLVQQKIPGFSVQSISGFETLRDFPKPEVQQAIADILLRPVGELFPAWLQEMRQERAIKEVPLTVLSELGRGDVKALQAFNRSTDEFDVEEEALHLAVLSIAGGQFKEALTHLTARERFVILQRFGFEGNDRHTLDEVGQMLGLTVERIRQVEAKALRKLRAPARSKHLYWIVEKVPDEPLSGIHLFQARFASLGQLLKEAEGEVFGSTPRFSLVEWKVNRSIEDLESLDKMIKSLDPAARGWAREKVAMTRIQISEIRERMSVVFPHQSRQP